MTRDARSTLTPAAFALGVLLGIAPAARALTLAEAIAAAAELQPGAELQSARAAEGGALAAQASSLFAADPALKLQHYNDGVGSGDGAREWEVGMAAPVWLPGQRAARRQVAAAATRQAVDEERQRRWQVAGDVRNRMWDVIAAARRVARLQRALDDARTLEQSVARRVEVGDLSRPELRLAERESLTRAAAVLEAQGVHRLAESRWHAYTGQTDLPQDFLETEVGAGEIDAAHPGLASLQAATDRAGAERDRARSDRRTNPTVSLGGRHERGPRSDAWNDAIAVGVQVPLGLPSQSAPAVSAAEYAYTEAAVDRQRAMLALTDDLAAARTGLDSARAALDLLRNARAAVEASLQQMQAAFDLGEETLVMLLQIRAQAQDAAMRAEEMELRVGRGIARVNQAMGAVPE